MTSASQRRDQVVLGPLPPSFLRLETRTSDGETVTTVTADPAIGRQVELPPGTQPRPNYGAQPPPQPRPNNGAQPPSQPRPHSQPAMQQPGQPYVPQAGLSITIAQAVLNKSYTLIGSMDPYVRLKVGHNTYETFTHAGADKAPCWNKVYHCPLPNTHSVRTVSVEIFDERALTDDQRIAYAKIAVPQSVFEGHTLDEWFPLSGKLGEAKEGSINLIVSYTTMPMITLPYQRIHYPYAGVAPQHFTPRPPPEVSEADISTIKDMFPEVDKEVIRTVLESKHGNVEAAVAAILDIMDGTGQ
ncbi:toll-interacting protein B-like [Bolinopsis microptera]|uniref:toll-interacting protein B-like n=1 Tax=Bolinopsis microptera TaxID=2820187 RepID=UPI00307A2466